MEIVLVLIIVPITLVTEDELWLLNHSPAVLYLANRRMVSEGEEVSVASPLLISGVGPWSFSFHLGDAYFPFLHPLSH